MWTVAWNDELLTEYTEEFELYSEAKDFMERLMDDGIFNAIIYKTPTYRSVVCG